MAMIIAAMRCLMAEVVVLLTIDTSLKSGNGNTSTLPLSGFEVVSLRSRLRVSCS